ncbi:MAG: 3-keto-5-aminohexanoate cleavage protein [Betaproteobacteria bacterium]|nr:3-keto-5-aminohexanoate cleavage protein [Betaproteobacteria bacterium]
MISSLKDALPPLSITLAPTGMVPTYSMSAAVPLTPDEIIRDVLACAEIGVSAVHLHARDENLRPTLAKEIYARIIGGIREKCPDLVLCVSCSGRGSITLEQRLDVLNLQGDAKPDMASLTLASMNFSHDVSLNTTETVKTLAGKMRERGIRAELEIFDLGMVNMMHVLIRHELLSPPYYANLLFGGIASAQPGFLEIGTIIAGLPEQTHYNLVGLGEAQMPLAAIAAVSAPGVRVGLEDNLWLAAGRKKIATNMQLVEKVHELAAITGRAIMTPAQLRSKLDL